jgi:hypothetical protein
MLVQNINHAVANAPQQEQGSDQQKEKGVVIAIGRAEQAAAFGFGTGIRGLDRCNHVLTMGYFVRKVLKNAGTGKGQLPAGKFRVHLNTVLN